MVDYFITNELAEGYGEPMLSNQSLRGRVLRQGDSMKTIAASWPGQDGLGTVFLDRVGAFVEGGLPPAEVFVCYCSILDDCWVSTSSAEGLRPIEVNSCAQLKEVADDLYPLTDIQTQTEESAS